MAIRGEQRGTSVKANARVARDQRITGKAGIHRRILHHQQLALENRVRAEGVIPMRLRRLQSHLGFEPLPLAIHQGHQCDGRLTDERSQIRDIVKDLLRRRVQYAIPAQGLESCRFVS